MAKRLDPTDPRTFVRQASVELGVTPRAVSLRLKTLDKRPTDFASGHELAAFLKSIPRHSVPVRRPPSGRVLIALLQEQGLSWDSAEKLERQVRELPWAEQDGRVAAVLQRLEGIREPEPPPSRKRRRTKRTRPSRLLEGTLIESLLKQHGIGELEIYQALILPQLQSGAKRAEDLGLPLAEAIRALQQLEQRGKVRALRGRRNTASGPQLIKTWALEPWN